MSTNSAEIIGDFRFDQVAREWVAGFLVVGMLLGVTGSLLIAWQYHIDVDPRIFGLHFLGLNAGYVMAAAAAQRLHGCVSIRSTAIFACALGVASLLALSFLVPPISAAWRILGLAFVGAAAGALTAALLYILEPYFEKAPAAVADVAGALFGCGCVLATLMVAVTYFASSVQIQTALLAVGPLIFLALYAVKKHPERRGVVETRIVEAALRDNLQDLRSVAAVLFSLLLFFQFGNEWAIAGWLPLFLIRRRGSNPVWAIFALGVYFLALTIGRIGVRSLLSRVNHRKLLMLSISGAMLGYLMLSFTTSMPSAWIAVIVIGSAFAPIYPLIAETLDDRFQYHPGFYNSIFSIAITGAMCMPWVLGYVDAYLGMQYVMLIPALGSVAVLVLALLIMLEAQLMGVTKGGNVAQANVAAAGKR